MFTIAIGHSEDIDSSDAVKEVLAQCQQDLGSAKAQAGLLYSAIDHDFDVLLQGINETHPGIELIGCTTDGEISSKLGFVEDTVSLILFHSDEIEFKAGVADRISDNIRHSISEAVRNTKASSSKENRLCIVNPVSLSASGAVVVEEFKKALGENFPIFGATAGDQWEFKVTHQFCKDQVYTDSVPFLIFSGNILFGSGVSSGWQPIGKPGIVTRVENNTLFSVNGKTAIDFYKHYLGENIYPIGEFPLAVYEGDDQAEYYLRSPLLINEEDGSIVFAGDLAEDAKVQITHATRDKIIEASEKAVSQSIENYTGDKPEVAICFSCAGRKQVLGTRTGEEIELLKKFNPNLKIFGFYGYGEIAPLQHLSPSKFHNETFISLLLGNT